MKYTKRQETMIDAGMTLCVECQTGYNGNQSCGSNGMQKQPLNSPMGCFSGKKINDFKGENCHR